MYTCYQCGVKQKEKTRVFTSLDFCGSCYEKPQSPPNSVVMVKPRGQMARIFSEDIPIHTVLPDYVRDDMHGLGHYGNGEKDYAYLKSINFKRTW